MITAIAIGVLLALIVFSRVPLGLAMGVVGLFGIAFIHPRGLSAALSISEQQIVNLAMSYQFSVLPLFILMGVFIVKAQLAEEMFSAARDWLGSFKGGLGMASIVACGGFAAMCGTSSAAAATMAKIAVPELDKAGYNRGFSAGTIAAGGTMGVLIPPSGALIIYSLLTQQSISALFVAGLIPGALQILFYIVVMAIIAVLHPNWAPLGAPVSFAQKMRSTQKIWPILALFLLIMVGLMQGWFSAIEAGGIGAGGAFFFLILRRKLTVVVLFDSLMETARIATMIFIVAAGAMVLNQFINVSGISGGAVAFIESLNLSPAMVVLCFVAFYLVLGCMLDGYAMLFLTVPVIAPIISGLGFDLVWWGIITVVVVEISLITPPVGLNVFILKAMLPHLNIGSIYRGILPYLASDLIRLAVLLAFPIITLWLPSLLA